MSNIAFHLKAHFWDQEHFKEPGEPGSKFSCLAIGQPPKKVPALGVVLSEGPATSNAGLAAVNTDDQSNTAQNFTHLAFLKTCCPAVVFIMKEEVTDHGAFDTSAG